MAAIAMLNHMPTSQAIEHATTLVSGTALPPTLHAAIIFPDIAQTNLPDFLYSHSDWTTRKQLHQSICKDAS